MPTQKPYIQIDKTSGTVPGPHAEGMTCIVCFRHPDPTWAQLSTCCNSLSQPQGAIQVQCCGPSIWNPVLVEPFGYARLD